MSVESSQEFINPIVGTLRLLAEMAAADPGLFRTKESRELLYRALTSSEQIDAVYASFEDGYHRVVTRIDDDRRRSDPRIPATASWHSSYIDAFAASENRRRHRTFFDTWPRVIGRYSVGTKFDERALPEYQAAKKTGSLAFAGPRINPDTGYPVISLMFPIVRDGKFIGCIGANITLDLLSRFLENHRASPGSTTIIADRSDAKVIAYPDSKREIRTVGDHLEIVNLDTIADPNLRAAYRQHLQTKEDDFLFYSSGGGTRVQRLLHQLSWRFWSAVAGDHLDPDQGLCRNADGSQPSDDRLDHCADRCRDGLDPHLCHPAVATD